MAKVADMILNWTMSPSTDIATQKLHVTINSEVKPPIELPAWHQQYIYTSIPANSSFAWRIESIDTEGKSVFSQSDSFTLGDLEDPFPATNLNHVLQAVRDE